MPKQREPISSRLRNRSRSRLNEVCLPESDNKSIKKNKDTPNKTANTTPHRKVTLTFSHDKGNYIRSSVKTNTVNQNNHDQSKKTKRSGNIITIRKEALTKSENVSSPAFFSPRTDPDIYLDELATPLSYIRGSPADREDHIKQERDLMSKTLGIDLYNQTIKTSTFYKARVGAPVESKRAKHIKQLRESIPQPPIPQHRLIEESAKMVQPQVPSIPQRRLIEESTEKIQPPVPSTPKHRLTEESTEMTQSLSIPQLTVIEERMEMVESPSSPQYESIENTTDIVDPETPPTPQHELIEEPTEKIQPETPPTKKLRLSVSRETSVAESPSGESSDESSAETSDETSEESSEDYLDKDDNEYVADSDADESLPDVERSSPAERTPSAEPTPAETTPPDSPESAKVVPEKKPKKKYPRRKKTSRKPTVEENSKKSKSKSTSDNNLNSTHTADVPLPLSSQLPVTIEMCERERKREYWRRHRRTFVYSRFITSEEDTLVTKSVYGNQSIDDLSCQGSISNFRTKFRRILSMQGQKFKINKSVMMNEKKLHDVINAQMTINTLKSIWNHWIREPFVDASTFYADERSVEILQHITIKALIAQMKEENGLFTSKEARNELRSLDNLSRTLILPDSSKYS